MQILTPPVVSGLGSTTASTSSGVSLRSQLDALFVATLHMVAPHCILRMFRAASLLNLTTLSGRCTMPIPPDDKHMPSSQLRPLIGCTRSPSVVSRPCIGELKSSVNGSSKCWFTPSPRVSGSCLLSTFRSNADTVKA